MSKSAFFERGWVTLSANFRGKGRRPLTIATPVNAYLVTMDTEFSNVCTFSIKILLLVLKYFFQICLDIVGICVANTFQKYC